MFGGSFYWKGWENFRWGRKNVNEGVNNRRENWIVLIFDYFVVNSFREWDCRQNNWDGYLKNAHVQTRYKSSFCCCRCNILKRFQNLELFLKIHRLLVIYCILKNYWKANKFNNFLLLLLTVIFNIFWYFKTFSKSHCFLKNSPLYSFLKNHWG